MKTLAMAFTMVVLAAAPMAAQQTETEKQTEHPHQCPHHQAMHQGGEHAMGQHQMGQHQMGRHQMGEMGAHGMGGDHAAMQEMHKVMIMMHHPEMLELSEAQVEELAALRDRVHADGAPQGPEAMARVVEETRAVLTAEQRERLGEMDHPMGEGCPMMQHGGEREPAGHGGDGHH